MQPIARLYAPTLLAALAVLLPFSLGCRRPPPPEPTPSEDQVKLQRLQHDMLAAGDESQRDWEALLHESETVAKRLLVLTDGQDTYPAVDVYMCTEPEDEFECRFIHADDTIHTTEFPGRFVPVQVSPDTPLHLTCPDATCPSTTFHLGDPALMHDTGYEDVKTVPVSEAGVLSLPTLAPDTRYVLFTLVRNPGEKMVRKYVWVIEKRQ